MTVDSNTQKVGHCTKCNAPMMNTPGGYSVCSKGCGKLYPRLDKKTQRRNSAIIALGLVDIEKTYFDYVLLPDRPGRWKVKQRISREITSRPKGLNEKDVLALDGDVIVVLEPLKETK